MGGAGAPWGRAPGSHMGPKIKSIQFFIFSNLATFKGTLFAVGRFNIIFFLSSWGASILSNFCKLFYNVAPTIESWIIHFSTSQFSTSQIKFGGSGPKISFPLRGSICILFVGNFSLDGCFAKKRNFGGPMIILFEDFLDTGPPEWKSNSSHDWDKFNRRQKFWNK